MRVVLIFGGRRADKARKGGRVGTGWWGEDRDGDDQ